MLSTIAAMLQAHTEVKATKMIASKQVAMLGIISSMGQNHFTDGVGRSELTGSHPVLFVLILPPVMSGLFISWFSVIRRSSRGLC